MKTNVVFAWLLVLVAVILAIVLRVFVETNGLILTVIVTLACLPIGFLLGGSSSGEPEAPGKSEDAS